MDAEEAGEAATVFGCACVKEAASRMTKRRASERRADAIRHLGVSRAQPFHGETGRTRSFTIELRGTRAKEADCIRPTSGGEGGGLVNLVAS
jgi:hypothetical protein